MRLASHALQTAAPLTAFLLCLRAGGAWRLLGLGALAWAVGQAAYATAEVGASGAEPAFPSLADAGFLAVFPFAVVGLLLHPAAPRGRSGVARVLVDGLIAGGAVRFLAWTWVLSSMHEGRGTGAVESAVGLAYAVGDFVVVAVAALVAMRATGRRRHSLLGVGAAFSVLALADFLYVYADLHGGYETGGPVDLLWVAGFLVLAVAARAEASVPAGEGLPAPGHDDTVPRTLFPYTLVVLAVASGLADAGLSGSIDTSQFWNAAAVGILVLVRQIVDRVHNVRLVRSLEATVAELRERDAQLEEAQRLAHLGSWKWDLATDTIFWTDEMYRIFGLDRTTFTPHLVNYIDLIHPDDRSRCLGYIEQAVRTGEPYTLEHRVAGADGRIVQCRGRAVMDDRGAFVQLVGTVQDVTTVRRLASELERRLAELERSNAELAHFASVASHDLAAPVQLLIGHLRVLRDRTRESVDLTDVELIEGAIRGAQRLDELIRDILDYSLATGDDDLRTTVDLERVVREAARVVGADHWSARVEIDPLPTVEAHPGQMRRLFQNLLSNALKFVPPDREPHIRVWAEPLPDAWCLCVADNGIGVDPSDRQRIFQMFERAGSLPDVRGTGIGLAICTRITARHGGHIWVEPAPAGGSIFKLTLAVGPASNPAPSPRGPAYAVPSTGT